MKLATFLSIICILLAARLAPGTLVFNERVEQFGADIAAVWHIKVTTADRVDTHMKLRNGGKGPVTNREYTYSCEVVSTVYGSAPADAAKTVTLRYSDFNPVFYDEDGKMKGGISFSSRGSGAELEKGKEYLVCLADARPNKGSYFIMRTESTDRRQGLLDEMAQARCWKLLASKHPGWSKNIRFSFFDSTLGLVVCMGGTPVDVFLLISPDAKEIRQRADAWQGNCIQLSANPTKGEIIVRGRDGKVWAMNVTEFKPEPAATTQPATAPSAK